MITFYKFYYGELNLDWISECDKNQRLPTKNRLNYYN